MKLRRKSVILRKYINFRIVFWKKLRHREQIPWPPVMAVVTNLMYAFSIIITSNMIFCKGKYYWTIDNLLPPGNKRRASFCLGSSLCSRYHRQHHHLEVITIIILLWCYNAPSPSPSSSGSSWFENWSICAMGFV